MSKNLTPSEKRRIMNQLAKELRIPAGRRFAQVVAAKDGLKASRSQFQNKDGIVEVKLTQRISKVPSKFWATMGPTGWEISFAEPKSATSIPEHHHALVKWAREQKNIELIETAIQREKQRENPRPFVLSELIKATQKYEVAA